MLFFAALFEQPDCAQPVKQGRHDRPDSDPLESQEWRLDQCACEQDQNINIPPSTDAPEVAIYRRIVEQLDVADVRANRSLM